ncbi:MAG TPA: helix-hairpin-helix domain-containing protein [Longimicrobiales bacterium]|nr:helix-hairpin-helix domain-containing protein [Longimicrobiales bacterium]
MKDRLRAFVEAHSEGWNHEDWLGLLNELRQEGVDVSDPDGLGQQLERTRLEWELRRRAVPGLGPKRSDALVDRFGSFWRLQHASVEEVARVPRMTRGLAEKVIEALR